MEQTLTHDFLRRAVSRLRKIELPWLILAALLLSTLLAAFQSSRQLRADADARFTEIAQGEKRALLQQLRDIENILYGAKAFATALPNVNHSELDTYVAARVRHQGVYPGIIVLQLVRAVDSPPAETTIMSLLAPSIAKSTVPTKTSSPALAEAISRATSTTALTMSRPLATSVGNLPSQDWVALTLPLPTTIDVGKRVSPMPQTNGAIIAVVAIVDLAAMVMRMEHDPAYPVVHELFDGGKRIFPASGSSNATQSSSELSTELPVEFGQRTLRLRISSTPQVEKLLRSDMPRVILVIGIFGTMLLGALVLLLTRLRQEAESLAASMTRKLQDQTRFTEDLIEFNPNPIFRKDTAGRFVAVNQAWEQLSGRKRKDILGKTSQDVQSTKDASQDESHDLKLLTSPSGYDASEGVFTNADGQQFETITAKKILKRADGSVDGMIGTITDVTLIKKLERELARQREQLDLVIRSSQQGIWDLDLSDNASAYYSPRFREILGYTDHTFPIVFDWQHHIHPEDRAEARRRVIAHFKGEAALFDIESRIRSHDQRYMWVRVRAIAQRNADGRAVRFVGSIADVTDRKLAEVELMEANVRVTEAARAKESFLATMSHEIRTPLNGVLGMTSLLSETTLNDEQHDYIRLIRASGDTLLRLIDDVLDFSKIESGRMTLESVTVELVPLVEEAFELVAEKARSKGLALLFEMQEDVPFYILGDATRLRQILLNLLSNAIKFTAKGEIRLVLSVHQAGRGQLNLEGRVSDTGIGIPTARANKLFQPFTQVDASTTRKYGGTGLGLAIVRRLSQLMGGDVGVESVEGQGSTFIFTILTSAVSGPQKPYMQRQVTDFMHKRLLVVDRNENRRKSQQQQYSDWGFDAVTTTPEDAVQLLSSDAPVDILLTEMELPSAESLAIRQALQQDDDARKAQGKPQMSVILLSATSRAELSQKQMTPSLRHDAFVMRPAGRSRMFDVLMRAVLHQPNVDVATRPYIPAPMQETQLRASSSIASARAGATLMPATPLEDNRRSYPAIKFAGRAPKILVAEDNEINQEVILGMLKNLGCETDLACDGSVAVKKAVAGDYDVILMDIHMPELDGVTAMQNIRSLLAAVTCPPIVAMTAHALPGDRERYLALGMNDYVSKPIRTGDLKSLFERLSPADANAQPPQITSVPSTTLPVLDLDQLEDLRYLPTRTSSDPTEQDPVGGLIQLFRTKANERIEEMKRLLADGDWLRLAEIVHSMRGSSASMGFPRVAADCKDLELAARRKQSDAEIGTPNPEKLDDLVELIEFHYREADAALGQWMKKSTASGGD